MPPKRKTVEIDDFTTLSNRLDNFEQLLKDKDTEIQDLKRIHTESTNDLLGKINAQQLLIAELQSKLEIDSSPLDPIPPSEPKSEQDLLIIGDSIVRDVDSSVINPGSDTTIKCLPGARPDDVVAEFRELAKSTSFKRIVVHVGTNLIPKFSPAYTADKITECLEMIRELAPSSKIAYSHILPKVSDDLLYGINFVNYQVTVNGMTGPTRTRFGHVSHCNSFTNSTGRVEPSLFSKDGIHLSRKGKIQLNNSIKNLVSK